MVKRIWKNPNTKRGAKSAERTSKKVSKNLIKKMGRWADLKRTTLEINQVMGSWFPGSTASSEILFNTLLQFYPEFKSPKNKRKFTSVELKKEVIRRMKAVDAKKLFLIEDYVEKFAQNRRHILSLEPELIELDNSIRASKKKIQKLLINHPRKSIEKNIFRQFGDILADELFLLKKIEKEKSRKLTQEQKTALKIMKQINLRDLKNISKILGVLKD